MFAYKLLQRGDNALAAEGFDQYLGRFPDAPKRGDAMYYRALLHRRAGDNQRAAELLRDAPAPSIVPRYAVDLLLGQVLADVKRYDEALGALERIDANGLPPQVRASVLYLRGLVYRGTGNLSAAQRELTVAAELDSELKGRALLDLARVQVLMDRRGEAIATLTRTFDLPEAATVAEAARLAGDLAYQQQQYELAASFYQRVAANHQSSMHFGPAVAGLLWSHYSAERYVSVLDAFEQYRTALPLQDRVAAWYLAGSAQQQLGHHEKAVELFEQIAHGEDFALLEKILYKLAVSYFELRRDDKMRVTIDRLGQQFPGSALLVDAAYLEAAADARRGDVSRGAARLTQIIDQGPDHPYYAEALLNRARLYEENQRYDAAMRDYATYLSTAPQGQSQAALRLIDLAYRIGEYQQAADAAQQLLARRDLDPLAVQEAMYRLALAKIKLDQPDEALAQLERLSREYPLNQFVAEAAYYRGVLLMSAGRANEALTLLLKAAESAKLSQTQRANALRLAALHYQESGQGDAAATALRQLELLVGEAGMTDRELLWLAARALEEGEGDTAMRYARPVAHNRDDSEPAARAEGLYRIGQAQRQLRRFDAAQRSFAAALAIGSDFDERVQLELARTQRDRGDTDAALAELSALASSETSQVAAEAIYDSAAIWRERARDRRRQEDAQGVVEANAEARRLLKRLVLLYPFEELTPLPQLAYLELAEIAAQSGEVETATGELRSLIDKFPDGPYATYARAVIAADQRMLGDALALLDDLKDRPLDPRLRSRAEALRRLLERQR